MFSKRQKTILLYLINSNEPVTATWISKELMVSDRTIRNDLKEIQEESHQFGLSVDLFRGKGYQVKVIDEELYKETYKELFSESINLESVDYSEQNNRIVYILNQFLLDNDHIKLETFEEKMFVSKSTIQNDLKVVREILAQYNLELVNRPHYGLSIKGEEYMKRLCLSNYIVDRVNNETGTDMDEIHLFNEEVYNKLHKIIVGKVNKYKIEISDISLENLAIHITIACKRIEEGFFIGPVVGHVIDEYPFEKMVANEIIKDVQEFTGLSFSKSEIDYIIIHLVGTKLLHKEELSEYSKYDEVDNIVTCMLKRLKTELNWDFSHDHEFIQAITLHIRPAMNRLRYKMNIRNPLLREIKIKYPIAFEGAVIASKCIKDYLSMEVGEHEIAYIALHIGVALERMKTRNKQVKRVIIVCASGVGSAKLLYYRLQNVFERELEIVATTNYYKLRDFDLSSIDFVITTVPIKEDIGVPVNLVNTFLEQVDINGIKNRLSPNKQEGHIYLEATRIFIKKNLSTKEDVIHFLTYELYKQGLVPNDYEKLVMERENSAPTSFGNLVAIPHPATPVTKETFWTICTLKRPVPWTDQQMAQFICLLNISETEEGDLEEMYMKLVSVVENRETVEKLINCNCEEELINLFN